MTERKQLPDEVELSNITRRVDGDHRLGAGALAEAIIAEADSSTLRAGSVIQFTEEHHWAGSLAIVSEVRGWGVQAYVPVPEKGLAFVRATTGSFEVIGDAVLTREP